MKLEQSFTVTAPVEQVWATLVDVERVAPCLPGAEITGQTPDGGYEGTFTVKLGPATAAYRGSLKMESLDEASRTATMSAKGTDKRGQGGATASIVSTMRQEGDDTLVEVVSDFTITGRLARFGRGGMIEDISKRLMRDFANCLQSTLAAEPAPATSAAENAALPPESERAQAEAAVASAAGAAAEAGAAAQAPPPASEAAPPLEPPTAAEPADTAAAAPLPGEDAAEAAPAREAPAAQPSASAGPVGGEGEAAGEAAAPEPAAAEAEPAPAAPEPAAAEPAAGLTPAGAHEAAAEEPAPAGGEGAAAPEEAAPAAAAGAPLPGEEAPVRRPGEVDPFGPLSPPAEPVAPVEEEPAQRTGSIPPPSATRPSPPPAKPVKGLSLLFGVLWDRIKRFFGRLFGRGGS